MSTDRERRRFWRRVIQHQSGCWIWNGAVRDNGYGSFAVQRADRSWTYTTAHRWAYRDLVAPVPPDMEVDHLCRTRACVRPDHLEAVTVAENRRRRDIRYSPAVDRTPRPLPVVPIATPRRDPQTHCRNGHAYAEVGKVKNGPSLTCGGCRAEQYAKRRKGGAHGTQTHCPQGHPYIEENIYWHPNANGKTYRECLTCIRTRSRVQKV